MQTIGDIMADTYTDAEREMRQEIFRLRAVVRELDNRLNAGRDYLMTVPIDKITVKNTLLAFGWNENGFDPE